MAGNYRAAVVGCGNIAGLHAKGYVTEPRLDVVALADINRKAAEDYAEEHGFEAAVYEDYEEMLSEERPDLVSICLWPDLHLPVARACVEAGVKAIHCEKPMAPSWGESVELVEMCEKAGVQLTFDHQRRFNHGILKARRMLDDGVFGDLERMDLFAPKHLLDCGTHSLDLGFMFNHENPVRWVIGQIDTRDLLNWFNVPGESMAVGMFCFENGVRGTIQVGEEKEMGTGARLTCSNGFIEVTWGGTYPRAVVYDDPGWEPPEVEEADPMPAVMANIADCLESGEEPELSARRALQAAEVIFAIYESSRRRARIDLPLETKDSALVTMIEEGEIAGAS